MKELVEAVVELAVVAEPETEPAEVDVVTGAAEVEVGIEAFRAPQILALL
jgi:hypothetical protein